MKKLLSVLLLLSLAPSALRAADEPAAREFMQADPCVVAGVMTAELHPYGLALLRKG